MTWQNIGERNVNCRFTDADVAKMRARRAAGAKLRELAEHYQTTKATVCNICKGRKRKTITPAPPHLIDVPSVPDELNFVQRKIERELRREARRFVSEACRIIRENHLASPVVPAESAEHKI